MKAFSTITPLLECIANLSGIAFQVRHNGQVVISTSSFYTRIREDDLETAMTDCYSQAQPLHQTLDAYGVNMYGTLLTKSPAPPNWLIAIWPVHWQAPQQKATKSLLEALQDILKALLNGINEIEELATELDRNYEELALYRRLQQSYDTTAPSTSDMPEIISCLREVLAADMVFSYFPDTSDLNITIFSETLQEKPHLGTFAKNIVDGINALKRDNDNHYFIINNSSKESSLASIHKRPYRLMATQAEHNNHSYGWIGVVSFDFYRSFKRSHLNMLRAVASQAALICANTHLLEGLEGLTSQVKTFKNDLANSLSNPSADADTGSLNPGDFLDKAFGHLSKSIEATKALMLRSAQMATMGQLAAVFAHEIKQPVCALDGFVQIAQLKKYDDEQTQDFKRMAKAVRRMGHIIKRFESFTQPYQQQFESISLNQIAREVYHLMRPQIELKGIEADLNRAADLPQIMADAQGLQQAVLNLVSNAIQALESNNGHRPRLQITTYHDGPQACLDVEDNGPGIPEDLVGKVTEPYFTTKNAEQGTGLGLSVVADIIEQHDGRLEIESRPGSGSRFTIKIPAQTERHQEG